MRKLLIFSIAFALGLNAAGQDSLMVDYRTAMVRDMLSRAVNLRQEYRFAEAVDVCEDALEVAKDSVQRESISRELMWARNGENMSEFCSTPVVVAAERFSREDFFLYCPLPDFSWCAIPNPLDSLSGFPYATFFPENSRRICFSAMGENGARNIYITERQGDKWSVPRLLDERLTSPSDEIFPILSEDGKTLFFSSKGMYGMGGYDIYVSQLDESSGRWSAPVNMGFPYSSPFDDFLFMTTPDGRYSVFASNRDCPPDSVGVWVTEYESVPVRKSLLRASDLKALHKVKASEKEDLTPVSPRMRDYISGMKRVQSLRDSLADVAASLEEKRSRLEGMGATPKKILSKEIEKGELKLSEIEEKIQEASGQLNEIEMDLLLSGESIDTEKIRNTLSGKGRQEAYSFVRHYMGEVPDMVFGYMAAPEGDAQEDSAPVENKKVVVKGGGGNYMVRFYPADGRSLGEGVIPAVRDITDADIARSSQDGAVSYTVGPYPSAKEADKVAGAIVKATGLRVEIESE